jgi:hypothetical protein
VAPAEPLTELTPAEWAAASWRRWLKYGALLGAAWLAPIGGLLASGQTDVYRMVAGASLPMIYPLIHMSGAIAMSAVIAAATGMLIVAGPFGAMFGALKSALAGPDINRKVRPNQGIRQSAKNVVVFALVGGLVLAPIWGLINLIAGAIITRTAPGQWDWMGFLVSSMPEFALIGALVPGAAVIQHFVLRLILHVRGMVPLNLADFCDYCSRKLLLRRVGGTYSFLHESLRNHLLHMPVTTPASS